MKRENKLLAPKTFWRLSKSAFWSLESSLCNSWLKKLHFDQFWARPAEGNCPFAGFQWRKRVWNPGSPQKGSSLQLAQKWSKWSFFSKELHKELSRLQNVLFEGLQKVLEARGLFSLVMSSHTFSRFLTSDTFSHLSAKSYHAGPKPAMGAIWVRPHLLMQFRAKSYHVSPKHLGAIWRPHPAKQFCGKSYHVFQTPFLQNVVQNQGFKPLSSKMWSKTL